MKLLAIVAVLLLAGCGGHAALTGSGSTPATVTLSMECPAPAAGSLVWRCTGTPAACGLSTQNWAEVGVIVGSVGQYIDSSGASGATYTWTGICTDGSIIAPPSNFFTSTIEEE